MVNIWQLNTHELQCTLDGHTATVICVSLAPNGLFAVSGSEDHTARVWGLTLGLVVTVYKVSKKNCKVSFVLCFIYHLLSSSKEIHCFVCKIYFILKKKNNTRVRCK